MPSSQDFFLSGGGLRCRLDRRTGRIVELIDERAGDAFVSGRTRPGGLEVFDELERKLYSDLHSPSTVDEVKAGDGRVEFVKRFEGAPFALRCRWRADAAGLCLDLEARLLGEAAMRSVRLSLVLPVTGGLVSWAPSYPPASDVATRPVRYCYLADERGKARTGIPMLTLYHPAAGGLSMVVPFETPKVQLNMGVEPPDPTPWYVTEHVPRINAGAEVDTITPPEPAALGAEPVVRFTEKHVGLRPGKPLPLSMWLFAHEPSWRAGLGRVVERYAEHFRPHPDALRFGAGAGANPAIVDEQSIQRAREFGVTHAWFHGHFEFHGEFLTDEALADPAYRWECEPYPDWLNGLGVEQIRDQIRRLAAAGVGTFLYGFNMHCDPTIVEKRSLHADVARNEDSEIARAYHDQPVMFFSPESPFGRQLLDQMERMIATYPQIVGLALDNWNYAGIDFGHDDGITMVNSKPAASINFSQQRMIGAIAERMHDSGRFVYTNKGRTIESMRGVDCVLTESRGPEAYATFAFMNLMRTIVADDYGVEEDPACAEEVLKYSLVWGGQMGGKERQADLEQARAYRPLSALIRNRRWIFQPDPLDLPAGVEGQIFRIDERSPVNPGAVVVTVVRPDVGWREAVPSDELSVVVRVPQGAGLSRAEWLTVERSGQGPVDCPLSRDGQAVRVALPCLGAAGVLKLT